MRLSKFLSPFKKDTTELPNVIYIAIEEVSEELLTYIAAINNQSLATTVQSRESLMNRIKKIAKYRNEKIVVPFLAFSVQNNGELVNKLCPFPYELDYPNKIEQEDIHVYEYHTVKDHLERGIRFKELEKILKARKDQKSDLIDYVIEIGKPAFKHKLETQIEKISDNCKTGKNVNSRIPLKRSKADIAKFLYNYDASLFNSLVHLCDYNPSNDFVAQMGTMVYPKKSLIRSDFANTKWIH